MKFFISLFCCFILFSKPVMANENNRRHTVGVGAVNCSQYLERIDSEFIKFNLYSWVSGYVSGYNSMAQARLDRGLSAKQLNISFLTQDYVTREVTGFCRHNPKHFIIDSADVILNKLPKM